MAVKPMVSKKRKKICPWGIARRVSMGFTKSTRPIIKPMLAMLEPITLPRINPVALLLMAARLVISVY